MFGSKARRSGARIATWTGVVAAIVLVGAGTGEAGASRPAAHVRPNAVGELDCNGFSPIQRSAKLTMVCADPAILHQRFEDHGHYIGHDEPSLRFISSKPGSGSDVTWTERLPVEPKALPTTGNPGSDVTHSFELSVAPWFSMNLCDPKSDPQVPCTPRSRRNAPHGSFPGGGKRVHGAAVLPAGLRAVRRLDQLRQHALVLGAHDRQRRVRRRGERATTTASSP